MKDGASLADVIHQLRGDLNYAIWQGEGKEPRFELGPIELEFTVVVDGSRAGHASAKLWVVDVSYDGKQSAVQTHRVKLVLNPKNLDGSTTAVSGSDIDGEDIP
jgi:NTP-dependent ternary system trypsin peptidase co-occuring protein